MGGVNLPITAESHVIHDCDTNGGGLQHSGGNKQVSKVIGKISEAETIAFIMRLPG